MNKLLPYSALHTSHPSYVDMNRIRNRYDIPFDSMTGEEIVDLVAKKLYHGNSISAGKEMCINRITHSESVSGSPVSPLMRSFNPTSQDEAYPSVEMYLPCRRSPLDLSQLDS